MIDRLADVDPERSRRAGPDAKIRDAARAIVASVEADGDAAVREATARFEEVRLDDLEVPRDELADAADRIDAELRATLERVRDRVRTVQAALVLDGPRRVETAEGVVVTVEDRPLARVGCYVPGGRAAYPSTALMTVTPARVAGVDEVVAASPPRADGTIPDATLAALHVAGVDRAFRVGGVQAIAALALGTETIPRVDKIVGPGNAYVDAAKRMLWGRVGIDMPAGPTELVVLADAAADPHHVAADLLAQAEHDPAAQAIAVTTDAGLADAVAEHVTDPVGDVRVLVAGSLDEATDWIDRYAPEHLQVMLDDPTPVRDVAAGTVFTGPGGSTVLGDYATGADHVLPTGGAARWTGALSATDMLRRHVVQAIDDDGFDALADDARRLARVEGLHRHAEAVEVRR